MPPVSSNMPPIFNNICLFLTTYTLATHTLTNNDFQLHHRIISSTSNISAPIASLITQAQKYSRSISLRNAGPCEKKTLLNFQSGPHFGTSARNARLRIATGRTAARAIYYRNVPQNNGTPNGIPRLLKSRPFPFHTSFLLALTTGNE